VQVGLGEVGKYFPMAQRHSPLDRHTAGASTGEAVVRAVGAVWACGVDELSQVANALGALGFKAGGAGEAVRAQGKSFCS
jgi:hypothetical protein